ncbi:MAG: PfkB family carbohydrate kinase [Ktedonobacterales bacterium]
MAITVVGSVALDTIETPFGSTDNVLGGATSYFSMAASLYETVNLVAVVGDDFPDRFLSYFKERAVDLRGLQVVPGKTFRWGGQYHLDMNTRDTLFTELGVFAGFSPALPDDYRSADIVFLANIEPRLQLDVLRQADSSAVKLRALDTMNLWIETTRDDLLQVMRGVDVLLIAEEEARQLADTPSLRAAAHYLLERGPRILIIKQGSYGSLLFDANGGYFAAPAYPLEDVHDPTGAGDAFAGGFLGYLASRFTQAGAVTLADYKRALIHGNILGSFACEAFGVERLRTLTPDDIAARYQEFVEFTHFEMPVI